MGRHRDWSGMAGHMSELSTGQRLCAGLANCPKLVQPIPQDYQASPSQRLGLVSAIDLKTSSPRESRNRIEIAFSDKDSCRVI